MSNFMLKMWVGADTKVRNAKASVRKFFTDERGDTNIVSMVVLIGIAVVLAVIFKDAIGKLISQILGKIGENAGEAIESMDTVAININ